MSEGIDSGAGAAPGAGEQMATGESSSGVTLSNSVDTTNDFQPASNINTRGDIHSGNEQPTPWEWSEGLPGEGIHPDWFHPGTFKSVAAQAEGYSKLHSDYTKRVGGFIGAPDGDYTLNYTEDMNSRGVSLNTEDAHFKDFNEFARDINMSQDAYTKLTNMFAESTHANKFKATEGMVEDYNNFIAQEEASLGTDESTEFNVAIDRAAILPGVSQKGLDGILNGITTADDARAFTALVNNSGYSPLPEQSQTGQRMNHEGLQERLGRLNGRPGPERDRLVADYQSMFPGDRRFGG